MSASTRCLTRAGPRFTECLVNAIAAVLAGHGYPPVSNVWDWSELEMALTAFLYKSKESK
ncbi:hypothetical protein NKH18_26490 [Streptomyces sp. M10(2022)]